MQPSECFQENTQSGKNDKTLRIQTYFRETITQSLQSGKRYMQQKY